MKKTFLPLLVLSLFVQTSFGQNTETSKNTFGVLVMTGARYDNLRMCVATPAGVKGGNMADIMLIYKHQIGESKAITFNLPVMRPLLFGFAFNMLQFEPEVTLEYHKMLSDKTDFITGPGLGLSFHYGPDYNSDLENRGPSFFAMGPFFSWQNGIAFKNDAEVKNIAGIKAFYVPLFTKDRGTGTVLGGALMYTHFF